MSNSTMHFDRFVLPAVCAALFLSLALAALALPQTAYAWFNDVSDEYPATIPVSVSGSPYYGSDVPEGVYSITASTSSSMCRLSNVTLTATGSALWVTFSMSGAYNAICPGTASYAASLTDESGTDASNYYTGDPFDGYVPHQFSMEIDALNVTMDLATYNGGKNFEKGKWYDRTVVFNSSAEVEAAVEAAINGDPGTDDPDPVDPGMDDPEPTGPQLTVPVRISSIKLSAVSHAYTGKAWKPSVSSVKAGSLVLGKKDYSVEYADTRSKDVGNYIVLVYGEGRAMGIKLASYKIVKAANKVAAAKSVVSKSFTAKFLKGKVGTFAPPKVTAKFGKAKWKVVAKDTKGVLSFSFGKVKVKKGAKKGNYTMKLKAVVPGTANYKAASTKAITLKVTVK